MTTNTNEAPALALDALADALAALGIAPADADSLLTLAELYGDTRADEALTR